MEMTIEGLAKEIQKLSTHTETLIDDLARVMAAEFTRVHERFEQVDRRFDRLEKRVVNVEELCEDHSGRFISLEDQLSKVQYTLDEVNPRDLKRRVEKLELRVA